MLSSILTLVIKGQQNGSVLWDVTFVLVTGRGGVRDVPIVSGSFCRESKNLSRILHTMFSYTWLARIVSHAFQGLLQRRLGSGHILPPDKIGILVAKERGNWYQFDNSIAAKRNLESSAHWNSENPVPSSYSISAEKFSLPAECLSSAQFGFRIKFEQSDFLKNENQKSCSFPASFKSYPLNFK